MTHSSSSSSSSSSYSDKVDTTPCQSNSATGLLRLRLGEHWPSTEQYWKRSWANHLVILSSTLCPTQYTIDTSLIGLLHVLLLLSLRRKQLYTGMKLYWIKSFTFYFITFFSSRHSRTILPSSSSSSVSVSSPGQRPPRTPRTEMTTTSQTPSAFSCSSL